MRRFARLFIAGVVTLGAVASAGTADGAQRTAGGDRPALAASRPVTAAVARPPSRKVTKLLVFVEENHSLSQMRAQMPFTFRLARRFGYANHYSAITHPSLPNYIAMASGRTYGINDDKNPSAHRLRGRSVFGQALRHGKRATVYAQGMPRNCALKNAGDYLVRHNPWTYFRGERRACRRHDVTMGRFGRDVRRGRLPNVGMVIPDACHDGHDCSLRLADDWFRHRMRQVLRGRDWRSGHLAVVLTADEDDRLHGNRVLTVVIHPSQHSRVVRHRLNHFSLTGLFSDVLNAGHMRHARSAPSMKRAFRLPTR
jgi:acid phosphatase